MPEDAVWRGCGEVDLYWRCYGRQQIEVKIAVEIEAHQVRGIVIRLRVIENVHQAGDRLPRLYFGE